MAARTQAELSPRAARGEASWMHGAGPKAQDPRRRGRKPPEDVPPGACAARGDAGIVVSQRFRAVFFFATFRAVFFRTVFFRTVFFFATFRTVFFLAGLRFRTVRLRGALGSLP